MSYSTRTRFVTTDSLTCSSCGATKLPGTDCANCTLVIPAKTAPALTRDAALAKVENLLRWWGTRLRKCGRAGHGTTAEEFHQQAVYQFLQEWPGFNKNPALLNSFARFVCLHAAASLRRQNRPPLGVSLSAFDTPADLVPDREHHRGPDFDELDDLRAALAKLEPQQADEVQRYFGAFGHRRCTAKELAARSPARSGRNAAGQRLKTAVGRLAVLMGNRS
jgi:hypothetical protein